MSWTRQVAPVRERGLKCRKGHRVYPLRAVAPVRERGLKWLYQGCRVALNNVAPARERGLKYNLACGQSLNIGRSREGARIEMMKQIAADEEKRSLPRGSED